LDISFNLDTIESITDTGIQKILKNFLISKNYDSEIAFSSDGIEEMNRNISKYNDGSLHQPIYKVRIYERSNRFIVGQGGNRKKKYVEAEKGTNLYYAIYIDEFGKRSFETIPLNLIIERKRQGLDIVPLTNNLGNRLLFHLSPFDLVYVPPLDEICNYSEIISDNLEVENVNRIYVVNDFSSTCYFTPNHLAFNIAPKEVDLNFSKSKNKLTGSFDTKTASFQGVQIKDVCIKLKVDRLGNISLPKKFNSNLQASNAEEPLPNYNNHIQITTLQSLEEQDREFTRNMSHDERMAYLQKLISITHSELDLKEIATKIYSSKINIKKTE
jgi:CRISPR-associated endonuclease Csn1